MDISKLFTAICSLVLIVCLTLSITTLVVLRNAIDENKQVQNEAERLVDELDQSLVRLENSVNKNADTDKELPANASTSESYVIRAYNGKIGAYTSSGSLIYLIDYDVSLLPKSARGALEKGIEVESLEALQQILMDYTS